MKNLYLLLATIIIIFSYGAGKRDSLLIKGNLYIPEKEVLLCEITDSGAYIIDRSYMKNNKYKFKGTVTTPKNVYVTYGILPSNTSIKLENKNYKITSYIEKRTPGTVEISAENKNNEYLISGELFLADVIAYLCNYNAITEVTDTIASSEMKNGNFKFKCEIDAVTSGYIDYGLLSTIEVVLENKKYEISSSVFDPSATKYITDSEEQNIHSLFMQNDYINNNKRDSIYKLQSAAMYEGDTDRANSEEKSYYNNYNEQKDRELELIKKYPNNFASVLSVYKWRNDVEHDVAVVKFDLLGDKYSNSSEYKYLKKEADIIKKLTVGRQVDNFTLENIDGEKISLYDIKGSIKVIDFTASWCAPCRALNPHLYRLYNEYNKRGFEIIAVSLDDKRDAWVKAVKEEKLPWAQISDLKGWKSPIALEFNVGSIPNLVVLDKDNRILGVNVSFEQVEDLLNRFYNQKK